MGCWFLDLLSSYYSLINYPLNIWIDDQWYDIYDDDQKEKYEVISDYLSP